MVFIHKPCDCDLFEKNKIRTYICKQKIENNEKGARFWHLRAQWQLALTHKFILMTAVCKCRPETYSTRTS